MMRFFAIVAVCIGILACHSSQPNTDSLPVTQGVAGQVTELTGNQMPSPDRTLPPPKGIKTTIYVYELTNLNQVEKGDNLPFFKAIRTKFIQSVESDASGQYSLYLPPGQYSLFTKVDGLFYGNSFDGANNINAVKVEENKVARLNITISAKAVF
jgi:hypothetical protein